MTVNVIKSVSIQLKKSQQKGVWNISFQNNQYAKYVWNHDI
jgi:hypothetical protein